MNILLLQTPSTYIKQWKSVEGVLGLLIMIRSADLLHASMNGDIYVQYVKESTLLGQYKIKGLFLYLIF